MAQLQKDQKIFNHYILTDELPRTGMLRAWVATHQQGRGDVLLKFLPAHVQSSGRLLEVFENSAQRCEPLTHPNIATASALLRSEPTEDHPDGLSAVSVELLVGESAERLYAREDASPPKPDEIENWARQLCRAVHYAHSRHRLGHGAIHPGQVYIDGQSRLKITDFQLSRLALATADADQRQHYPASRQAFHSPQQRAGQRLSGGDDIFALGGMILFFLTGEPPRKNLPKPAGLIEEIRSIWAGAGFPPIQISEAWAQVILKCLHPETDGRFPSIEEMARHVNGVRLVESVAESAPAPTPSPPATEKPVEPETPGEPAETGAALPVRQGVLAAKAMPAQRDEAAPASGQRPAQPQTPGESAAATPTPAPGQKPPIKPSPNLTPQPSGAEQGKDPRRSTRSLTRIVAPGTAPAPAKPDPAPAEKPPPKAAPETQPKPKPKPKPKPQPAPVPEAPSPAARASAAYYADWVDYDPEDGRYALDYARNPLFMLITAAALFAILLLAWVTMERSRSQIPLQRITGFADLPTFIGVEDAQPVAPQAQAPAAPEPTAVERQRDLISSAGTNVPAGGRGFLWVNSDPPGADLFWNDQKMGESPMKMALPVGEQVVTARMTGRADRRVEANITQERDERVTIDFTKGELRLTSNPARAAVYYQGEQLGVTPESIEVEPGVIEVELRRNGYEDATERFMVRPGQVVSETVTLTPTTQEER